MSSQRQGARGKPSPDEQAEVEVLAALCRSPDLQEHSIGVRATRDTLSLVGRVPSAAQRALAQRIAVSCAGGRRVDNQLGVAAAGTPPSAGSSTPNRKTS